MNKISFSPIEITKKLGYVLLAVIILFIFFVDYFLFMRPQFKAISSLGAKASAVTKDIKETHLNSKKIDLLKAEAARLQEKLGKVEKSILPVADMTIIADRIFQLAAQYDVQINQVAPAKESQAKKPNSDKGEYLGLPVLVEGTGGYHNIGLFFNSLESAETFMNIQSFQISQSPRSTKKHLLTMVINVFVLKKDRK